MARIRTVKPELFKHSGLYDLEVEMQLPIRLAFIGMFTACDREGRFKWRPRELRIDVLPHDDIDFSRVLDALASRGFLVKYVIGTESYGFIPSWKEHQFVNAKESKSVIPPPLDACLTRDSRDNDATGTGGSPVGTRGVKEGKEEGKEGVERAPAIPPRADSEEITLSIFKAHPNNAHLGERISPLQLKAIVEAIGRDGHEKVLRGTKAFAAAMKKLSSERDREMTPGYQNPEKFFTTSEYAKAKYQPKDKPSHPPLNAIECMDAQRLDIWDYNTRAPELVRADIAVRMAAHLQRRALMKAAANAN